MDGVVIAILVAVLVLVALAVVAGMHLARYRAEVQLAAVRRQMQNRTPADDIPHSAPARRAGVRPPM